ncbi:FAD-binding oxidoreductase [Sphingomonas parva]|uniref:FAD-binding oxidoreductase n=1 Tax=Sphingomonas parva TaxID=2555898 RepID=A0A4Y8ZPC7_9SPHN|nr:FAD-dependent oxidoreductase [Sphingomonas parva]TFI57868.1 FAD-binding oxidoreductase [Sphingomonas parva]
MSRRADVAIVGAGIAGASLAAEIAGEVSVLLLEAEEQPGYHSTGRSAAFWSETYGGPAVQPLTTASGPWLEERGFLGPRGGLHIAAGDSAPLDALARELGGAVELERLGRSALEARVPGLRPAWRDGLYEPTCADIDVAALHACYLKQARGEGAQLVTGARVERATREDGAWVIETRAGTFIADILVDAAGAWADEVAGRAGLAPIGIQPYRRTVAQLRVDPPAPADLPLVIDALGRFYFKPEAGGRIWLSPHDETAMAACDCAPDELDVAIAIERLESVVDWTIERVEHKWAGLRTFAPDRVPVYGFAPRRRDFFWFAGQGGFGIQTAPAAAKLAAALLLDRDPDPMIAGIDPELYSPERFVSGG